MNLPIPSLRKMLLSAALLSLPACNGSEGTISLGFSAHEGQAQAALGQVQSATTLAPPTFQSSDGVTFTLRSARIHLRDIRLDLPQGTQCEEVRGLLAGAECKGGDSGSGSGTVLIPGPLVVDLMTGTTTPSLADLRLPAGTYKRIDFRLDEGRADQLPANEPLIGYSLKVQADFSHETGPSTLELALKFSEDARFESANGVEIGADDELLALLNPQVWLSNLPVGQCLQKGDLSITNGVLRIDDQAKGDCSGAEGLVKENIKRSGDLRKAK